MTTAPRRTVRRGQQHRPSSIRVPRSFPPRSSRPSNQPSSHNHAPTRLPPTPVGVPPFSNTPQHVAPAPPPANIRLLDALIDTRKLSVAELDRLQDLINSRDAAIEGRQEILQCQRRGISSLDKIIATKQRTIDNQRTSNASLHVTLDKARQENLDLRNKLTAERERSAAASAAPVSASRLDHRLEVRREDAEVPTKATHGAVGHVNSDACLGQDTDSRVADAPAGVFGLHQKLATAERNHQAILADSKKRERMLQEQLEEASAVIAISQAKLPELLEKSKRVDQLVADLKARDTALADFSLAMLQIRTEMPARIHNIDVTQHNLTSAQDTIIQPYVEQIQHLTAQNADQNLKANEAVMLGRRMVDLIFARIPWQYVGESLPELQALEEQFTAALSGLSK